MHGLLGDEHCWLCEVGGLWPGQTASERKDMDPLWHTGLPSTGDYPQRGARSSGGLLGIGRLGLRNGGGHSTFLCGGSYGGLRKDFEVPSIGVIPILVIYLTHLSTISAAIQPCHRHSLEIYRT